MKSRYVLLNLHPEEPEQGPTVCSFGDGRKAFGTYNEVAERGIHLKELYPEQVYAIAAIHYTVEPVTQPVMYELRGVGVL